MFAVYLKTCAAPLIWDGSAGSLQAVPREEPLSVDAVVHSHSQTSGHIFAKKKKKKNQNNNAL